MDKFLTRNKKRMAQEDVIIEESLSDEEDDFSYQMVIIWIDYLDRCFHFLTTSVGKSGFKLAAVIFPFFADIDESFKRFVSDNKKGDTICSSNALKFRKHCRN